MSVATLTVLALRASTEQVGTHLLCLLIVSFSFYLPNFVLCSGRAEIATAGREK